MFVERFERADEDSSVLQDTAHPEVDVLQHLTALTDRLEHKQEERVQNNMNHMNIGQQMLVVNRTFI